MGMKKGFKQTELGWIPEGWEVKKLNDISEKIMVGIASAATHAYRERGIIMFRNQNIKSNFLDDGDILFIAPDYEQIYKNKRLKYGDLLTARTGYPGTTCIVPNKYDGAQSFTTLITRLKNEAIVKDFACFYINSEIGQDFFEANQIGGGQKNVNAGTLKKMPIPIPPLPEQTAIATALSDTDALLNSFDTLLTKKRNLKQATMQRLLTPGEGWVVKRLEEICEKIMVGIASAATHAYRDRGVIMFRNQNIKANFLYDNDILFIDPDYEQIYRNKRLKCGDLLTARTGYPGTTCLIPEKYDGAQSFTTLISRLKNESISKEFVCFYINSEIGQAFFDANQIGGGQKNVNAGTLKKMPISLPSLSEQTCIATILTDLDRDIEALERKIAKYKALKTGLMQNLLTGRIRLL